MGRLGTRYRFNHTSWMAVVTPTDCLKSVRNGCVIEVFVLSIACWVFCWYKGFRHRIESDLVLHLLMYPQMVCFSPFDVVWNSLGHSCNLSFDTKNGNFKSKLVWFFFIVLTFLFGAHDVISIEETKRSIKRGVAYITIIEPLYWE